MCESDVSALLDLPEVRTLDLDVRGFARRSDKYQPSYEEVMSLVHQRGVEGTTAGSLAAKPTRR